MRLVSFCIAVLSACTLQAQLTYARIDSISYAQYVKGDAKGLRHTLKEAKAKDIDFYYLRMRAGIAHYNKGNYEFAASQFKRASKRFPADSLAAEYLYFSYAYTGRSFEAMQASKRLNTSQKKNYGIRVKPIESVTLTGGYAVSNNKAKNGDTQLWATNAVYGEYFNLNNWGLGQLTITGNIAKRVRYTAAYTYLNLQNTHRVQDGGQNIAVDFTTTQHDGYLAPSFYLGKGFYFSPAGHIINYRFNTFIRTYYPAPPVSYIDSVSKINYYGGAELGYRFTYGNIGLTGGISNINNDSTTYHAGAAVTYYPLGNTRLYGTTKLLYLKTAKNYFVFSQKIGFMVSKKIWAEANFSKGRMRFFADDNGFSIYNTPDEITMRTGINLNFYLSKLISLNFGYSYITREGSYLRSVNYNNNTFTPTTYNNHLVLTGITFTP